MSAIPLRYNNEQPRQPINDQDVWPHCGRQDAASAVRLKTLAGTHGSYVSLEP
jgi:hypothetical protein